MKWRLWCYNFFSCRHQQNVIQWLKLHCIIKLSDMWPKLDNCSISTREVIITERGYHNRNFIRIWSEEQFFFEVCSSFKFNIWNLHWVWPWSLHNCRKGLKLKVRKFCRLIPRFAEITEEKLIRFQKMYLRRFYIMFF